MPAALHTAIVAGLFALCLQPPPAQAQQARKVVPATAAAAASSLSPAQRGELTRQLVLKWGGYVERTYNVPVGTWAKRMVPNFATADANNLRNALKRSTFEGAMAVLAGQGQRMSDDQVITRLAKASPRMQPASLGSADTDLVYTPLQPCRVMDTRLVTFGQLPGNSTRDFAVVNRANFSDQGGSPTDCGTGGINAAAVVVNVTAVLPVFAGYATVHPFGTTRPLTASLNYMGNTYTNNTLVAKLPVPLTTQDITLYTTTQADYVVDIVGYYAAPTATAVECTVATNAGALDLLGGLQPRTVSCPAGYAATGGGCGGPLGLAVSNSKPLVTAGAPTGWRCDFIGSLLSVLSYEVNATCCRVPGR